MQCTESLVSLKISVTFSIGAPLSGECVCCCQLSYDLLCTGYFYLSYLTRRILNCWLISPRLPWTLWCICSARWPGAASLCRWALWAPRTGLTSLRASGRSWMCCEPARWRSVLLCGPSCPHRSAAGRRGFLSGGKKKRWNCIMLTDSSGEEVNKYVKSLHPWNMLCVFCVLLTSVVLLKEMHFLLQEGVKQQMFQSLVQSGQGAHKDASSHAREHSAVKIETLKIDCLFYLSDRWLEEITKGQEYKQTV